MCSFQLLKPSVSKILTVKKQMAVEFIQKIGWFYLDKFWTVLLCKPFTMGWNHFWRSYLLFHNMCLWNIYSVTIWISYKNIRWKCRCMKTRIILQKLLHHIYAFKLFFGCGRRTKKSSNMGQKGNTIFSYFLHWQSISWYVDYCTVFLLFYI